MELRTVTLEIKEKSDSVNVVLPNLSVAVLAKGTNGAIMVCNDHEERIYHIRKTKHGGFKLIEGTLL